MPISRRIAWVLMATLVFSAWGARAAEPDCSNWSLGGISAEMSEAEYLASFGDAPPERYSLSSKKKPRYIQSRYRPEVGLELDCFVSATPISLNSASTYFDKNGLVRHFIRYAWPIESGPALREAVVEAEKRRRGKPVAGKGDEALQMVQRCAAELGSKLETRLGPADEEARSIKIPGTTLRVYRAKSWTSAECGTQIVYGLFAPTTVSADDAECCGELTIVLLPSDR